MSSPPDRVGSFLSFAGQNCIVTGIADALIVPVSLSMGAFVFHSALCHDLSGIRIIGVVHGFYAVIANLIKEKIYDSL